MTSLRKRLATIAATVGLILAGLAPAPAGMQGALRGRTPARTYHGALMPNR